jgi:hypothetical protein
MPSNQYHSPVDPLLSYGDCMGDRARNWPDYVQELDLSADHIPELIQMVQDELAIVLSQVPKRVRRRNKGKLPNHPGDRVTGR